MVGMRFSAAVTAVLIAAAMLHASAASAAVPSCPCTHASHCNRVQVNPAREVFAFSTDDTTWRQYNWTLVTTVIGSDGSVSSDLMCTAHANGARAVLLVDFPTHQLANATARAAAVASWMSTAETSFLDGINIDFESAVAAGSPEQAGLTALVQAASTAFHAKWPHSQVTFDVAWSPNGIDGRFYDWQGLADATDFLFIMSYDMRSQIFPPAPCVAGANSPLPGLEQGVAAFLKLGLKPSKLVLGVPWYGYDYTCLSYTNGQCAIQEVPFRGVACSDAAGTQVPYGQIYTMLAAQGIPAQFDSVSKSMYSVFKVNGTQHVMWFDDPLSLMYKYSYAASLGLRGVGMWAADFLPYTSSSPTIRQQADMMWNAIAQYLHE